MWVVIHWGKIDDEKRAHDAAVRSCGGDQLQAQALVAEMRTLVTTSVDRTWDRMVRFALALDRAGNLSGSELHRALHS